MYHRTIIVLTVALAALLLIGAVASAARAPTSASSAPAGQLIGVTTISVRCQTDTCSGLDLRFADGGRITIAAPGDARADWTMIAEAGASRADQEYAGLLAQAIATRSPSTLAQALSQALRR